MLWNFTKQLGIKPDKGSVFNQPAGEMRLSLYGGRLLVIAKSAQYPERLVGEGLSGVVLAEAAKMGELIWTRFVRPTLADSRGWSLHTSTPEGRNHFYTLYSDGQNATKPDWASWRMPSWANDVIYPGGRSDPEINALATDLTPESFKQEVAAEFTTFAGRVFPTFSEELHVRDFNYQPTWETFGAVDWGFTNPTVWLVVQLDPYDETAHVVDELYETGLTPEDVAEEIRRRGLCPTYVRTFYGDPASPADNRTLAERLRIRSGAGTGGELKARLNAINAALKVRNEHLPEGHKLRHPRLIINRRCENTIREMSSYRYPKTASEAAGNVPENPLKKDDHAPEALGRFYAGHYLQGRVGARISPWQLERLGAGENCRPPCK